MPNQMAALVLAAETLAVSALATSVGGSRRLSCSCARRVYYSKGAASHNKEPRHVAAAVHGISTNSRNP